MKRSSLSAPLVLAGAALTLFGCSSTGSFEEIEKAPLAFQRDSAKPREQVAACLSNDLSRFGSDLGRFSDIEFGLTRLTLGGQENAHYRNYYRIDIIEAGRGSHVSVRRSKAQDNNLTMAELANVIARCTD